MGLEQIKTLRRNQDPFREHVIVAAPKSKGDSKTEQAITPWRAWTPYEGHFQPLAGEWEGRD